MHKMLGLLAIASVLPASAWAKSDPHGYEAVLQAITSPMPQQMVELGQQADDQMISQGQYGGQRVYLVTDGRSRRVNAIADRLLKALGAEPSDWIVRVLDTEPEVPNAFVFGGRYIYVYTGLIAEAKSDDELAVVIGHEIGRSVLKHLYRREIHKQSDDDDDVFSFITTVVGGSAYQRAQDAAYSRRDEEEADVFGVTIARRAGYDPLRGADFFTRSKRNKDKTGGEMVNRLNQTKAELDQLMAACAQYQQAYNGSPAYRTEQNYNQMVYLCNQTEAKRVEYNQFLPQYNAWAQQQNLASFYSTHPMNQKRIAAVVALNDFLAGRRNVDSLKKHEQTHTVVRALKASQSVLLAAPDEKPRQALRRPSGKTVSARLWELEKQLDEKSITYDEYITLKSEALVDN